MKNAQRVATRISSGIAEMGPYNLITEGKELPVFAVALKPDRDNYTVFDVSDRLRQKGWLVPAYSVPGKPPGPQRAADRRPRRDDARHGRPAARATSSEETDYLESLSQPLPGPKPEDRKAFAH